MTVPAVPAVESSRERAMSGIPSFVEREHVYARFVLAVPRAERAQQKFAAARVLGQIRRQLAATVIAACGICKETRAIG